MRLFHCNNRELTAKQRQCGRQWEWQKAMVSWTIKQPIELTITRFPGLFRFNLTHKTLTKLDEKNSKENSSSLFLFYVSSRSNLLSTHVLITLFGSPSPNLVVLINVTKLWRVGLVNLSYNGFDLQNNKVFARASRFLTFLCRHCTTTTRNFLISCFVKKVNAR